MINTFARYGVGRHCLLLLWLFLAMGCHVTEQQSKVIHLQMQTQLGVVDIELYPHRAPHTVSNFLRYVDAGQYDNGNFYRVVRPNNDQGFPKITVIQGDVADTDKQYPPVVFESTKQTGLQHLDGTLSMARLGPDTATSAFFICVGAQPGLDFGAARNPDKLGFAAFGRVTKGMAVIEQINRINDALPGDDPYLAGQMLAKPVIIHSIRRR